MAEQTPQQLQLKVPDEVLKGVYANATQVVHTSEEFVIDFLNLHPLTNMGIVNARITVSPAHCKRIVAALAENVQRYEQQFGEIKMESKTTSSAEITTSTDHKFGFDTDKAH